jgi:hypothetical protein
MQYPADWLAEPFAYHDRHVPGIHSGHLTGLPLQILQPTQLDMLQFDTQQAIVGFFAPTWEAEPVSPASFVVLVEKVPGANALFTNQLDSYVESFVFENVDLNNPYRNADVQVMLVESYETSVAGNRAITIILEKHSQLGSGYHYREKIMNLFIMMEDRIYTLEYTTPFEKYDEYFPAAQLMIESFQTPSVTSAKQSVGVAVLAGILVTIVPIGIMAKKNKDSRSSLFLSALRRILPAALGIEILCLSAAEIGGNLGLLLFGFSPTGIALSYALVYALAGFTTLCTILGRKVALTSRIDCPEHVTRLTESDCGCRSFLEDSAQQTVIASLKGTLKQFAGGFKNLVQLHSGVQKARIVRTSLIILITAESGCIITAATVEFVLYQYSIFVSIPLSLAAGTFAVAAPQAIKLANKRCKELLDVQGGAAA